MRQAIVTKYLGPTNFKGSRVKATAEAGSVTLSWDDALGIEENHLRAAVALREKFNWHVTSLTADLIGGALPGGGYVFVSVERSSK